MKFNHLSMAAAALLLATATYAQDTIPGKDTLPAQDTITLPKDTVSVPPTDSMQATAMVLFADTTDPGKDTTTIPEDTTKSALAMLRTSAVSFYQDTTTDPKDTTTIPTDTTSKDTSSSSLALAMVQPYQGLNAAFYQDTTTDPKKDTTTQPTKDTSSTSLALVVYNQQDFNVLQDTTTLPKRDTTDKPAKDSVPTTDSTTTSVAVINTPVSVTAVAYPVAAVLPAKNESLT